MSKGKRHSLVYFVVSVSQRRGKSVSEATSSDEEMLREGEKSASGQFVFLYPSTPMYVIIIIIIIKSERHDNVIV